MYLDYNIICNYKKELHRLLFSLKKIQKYFFLFAIILFSAITVHAQKQVKLKRTYTVNLDEKGDTAYLLVKKENLNYYGKVIVELNYQNGKKESKKLYFYENRELIRMEYYRYENDTVRAYPDRLDSIVVKKSKNEIYTSDYYFERNGNYSSGWMHDYTVEYTDSSGKIIMRKQVTDKWEYDKTQCDFFLYDDNGIKFRQAKVFHCDERIRETESRWTDRQKNDPEKYSRYLEEFKKSGNYGEVNLMYDEKDNLTEINFGDRSEYYIYNEKNQMIKRISGDEEWIFNYNENGDVSEQYVLKKNNPGKKQDWLKYYYAYFGK